MEWDERLRSLAVTDLKISAKREEQHVIPKFNCLMSQRLQKMLYKMYLSRKWTNHWHMRVPKSPKIKNLGNRKSWIYDKKSTLYCSRHWLWCTTSSIHACLPVPKSSWKWKYKKSQATCWHAPKMSTVVEVPVSKEKLVVSFIKEKKAQKPWKLKFVTLMKKSKCWSCFHKFE